MKLLFTTLLAALLVMTAAHGDQRNPELDELFALLQSAADSEEAQAISRQIWANWYQHDDAEIERLMASGETALRRGRLKAAAAIYSRVVKRDPEFAEGWNRRATTWYLMGRYAEATADVAATLALEPRHFGALSGQGMIYMRLNNPDKAIEHMAKALAVYPRMPGVRETMETLKQQRRDAVI